MKATAEPKVETNESTTCCHHWMLGQPIDGVVPAVCRNCGQRRGYPAVLDDLDPPAEPVKTDAPEGVATAVGGARPSSVASSQSAAFSAAAKLRVVPATARTRRTATAVSAKAALTLD
jgi:hypothetical protein